MEQTHGFLVFLMVFNGNEHWGMCGNVGYLGFLPTTFGNKMLFNGAQCKVYSGV